MSLIDDLVQYKLHALSEKCNQTFCKKVRVYEEKTSSRVYTWFFLGGGG
jgi:hypothetical protein